MDELTALVSQALATVAMASKVLATAEPIASDGTVEPNAVAIDVRTASSAAVPGSPTTKTDAPRLQEHSTNSTVRETNAAYTNLRAYYDEINTRCMASIKNLRAASLVVARPGAELDRSYEAYSHAHKRLQAAEGTVRDAEARQAVAAGDLLKASEGVVFAERELARALTALRDFDVHIGSSCSSSSSRKGTEGGDKQRQDEENEDDDDKEDENIDSDEASIPRKTTLLAEGDRTRQNGSTRNSSCQRTTATRERLAFAVEAARVRVEHAEVDTRRMLAQADAALTLVGARTAGEWSLAAEAYDAAKKRFQRAGIDAIPKIKEFAEKADLFRNLNGLRNDTRKRLAAASAAVAVATSMSAPVATAVAFKAAAEAAGRAATEGGGGGSGVSAPLAAPTDETGEDEKEEHDEEGGGVGGDCRFRPPLPGH